MVFDLTFITYEFFRLVVSNMDRLEGLFLDGLIDVFYLTKKRVLRELRIRFVTILLLIRACFIDKREAKET